MSGGSYDYAYRKVQDFADELRDQATNPLRAAFAEHLALISKAMRDIEWVDSGDCGSGDEDDAIRAVLGQGCEVTKAIELAEKAIVNLSHAVLKAKANQ